MNDNNVSRFKPQENPVFPHVEISGESVEGWTLPPPRILLVEFLAEFPIGVVAVMKVKAFGQNGDVHAPSV